MSVNSQDAEKSPIFVKAQDTEKISAVIRQDKSESPEIPQKNTNENPKIILQNTNEDSKNPLVLRQQDIKETPKIILQNPNINIENPLVSRQQNTNEKSEILREPNEILFVRQNIQNFKENIQYLIPKFNNDAVKNILNEMLNQVSTQKNDETFSFVKIDGKQQNNFLPVLLQTQFNSEFCAVLSKNFPQLPKELLSDTANIIRAWQKPFVVSQSLLKDLESVLQNVSNSNKSLDFETKITPQNQPDLPIGAAENKNQTVKTAPSPVVLQTPQETPILRREAAVLQENPVEKLFDKTNNFIENVQNHEKENPNSKTVAPVIENLSSQPKITAPVLSNLIIYLGDTKNREIMLPIFKTLFLQENSVENILEKTKDFAETFEKLERLEYPKEKNVEPSNNSPRFLSNELRNCVEKLGEIQNILKNFETISKKENPIEYIVAKLGILSDKADQQKVGETLKSVLKEIVEHIKTASQRIQNMPNFEVDEKLNSEFAKLKNLANSVNDVLRKIDGAGLLANKTDVFAGRSEQTIIVPVQIENSWIQMELRVNKDAKNKHSKNKKQAQQVEVSVELDRDSSVLAKANLTLEKQLQVSINFTNEKMLEWFKDNYKGFYESLENVGAKSVSVAFNREKAQEIDGGGHIDVLKGSFDVKG